MLSSSCCHAPAACNVTPRRDAAYSSLLFWPTQIKIFHFIRSIEAVYGLRTRRACSQTTVNVIFTALNLWTRKPSQTLTQLSRRTMVCGCRTNFWKSKPRPASEAPYALAPAVSSMSLPFSQFPWSSPRPDRNWLPASTKLNLDCRQLPQCCCFSWRNPECHSEELRCSAARQGGGVGREGAGIKQASNDHARLSLFSPPSIL